MTIESATNLPPHFRNGLLAAEGFLSKYPGLAVSVESVSVEDGHATIKWPRNGFTYGALQDVAKAHQALPWKRERRTSDYSWVATEGDVTVMLPHCEPLEYTYERTVVDFSKLISAGTSPAA